MIIKENESFEIVVFRKNEITEQTIKDFKERFDSIKKTVRKNFTGNPKLTFKIFHDSDQFLIGIIVYHYCLLNFITIYLREFNLMGKLRINNRINYWEDQQILKIINANIKGKDIDKDIWTYWMYTE